MPCGVVSVPASAVLFGDRPKIDADNPISRVVGIL